MEEHLSPLAVTHLLQHTLRSLCFHENSQWIYAVFWRILPRNYPPPKWDGQGAVYDRSRGNRRNWILVWEDGFCNFGASELQPDLFFKMSHEIYNYGEGLIGKAAADHTHKWIYKEPNDQEINFLSSWHNSAADTLPRTWEAQFQSSIKTIALIAVREGVIQLGAAHKVIEDLSYVVLVRKKFNYIESIPGVLLPHPSWSSLSSSSSEAGQHHNYKVDDGSSDHNVWQIGGGVLANPPELYHNLNQQYLGISPSMSSLEALLSKLPSVIPPNSQPSSQIQMQEKLAKKEIQEEVYRSDHYHEDEAETSTAISMKNVRGLTKY